MKKKLNLNDLKIESFITSIENKKINTIKGGTLTFSGKNPLPQGGVTTDVRCIVELTIVSIQKTAETVPPAGGTKPEDTQANDATAGCCAPEEICNTNAYCGNSHDGGIGCSYDVCM